MSWTPIPWAATLLALVSSACSDSSTNSQSRHEQADPPSPIITRSEQADSPSSTNSQPRSGRANSIHAAIQLAPVNIQGKTHSLGEWTTSATKRAKSEVNILVVASWCPFSTDMLNEMADDPAYASRFDFVVVFETEFADAVEKGASDGQINAAEKKALLRHAKKKKIFLTDPEALARTGLEFNAVRDGEFKGVVQGFPSPLTCGIDSCRYNSALRR